MIFGFPMPPAGCTCKGPMAAYGAHDLGCPVKIAEQLRGHRRSEPQDYDPTPHCVLCFLHWDEGGSFLPPYRCPASPAARAAGDPLPPPRVDDYDYSWMQKATFKYDRAARRLLVLDESGATLGIAAEYVVPWLGLRIDGTAVALSDTVLTALKACAEQQCIRMFFGAARPCPEYTDREPCATCQARAALNGVSK